MSEVWPPSGVVYKIETDEALLARVSGILDPILATPKEQRAPYGWIDPVLREAEGLVFYPLWQVVSDPSTTAKIEVAAVNISDPKDGASLCFITQKKPDESIGVLAAVLPTKSGPILLLPQYPNAELSSLGISSWDADEAEVILKIIKQLR